MPPKFVLPVTFCISLTLCVGAAAEERVSPECRGVAAGVVAAMRAAEELNGAESTNTAITAARRACMAAREDLGGPSTAGAEPEAEQATESKKPSVWELLSSDQPTKPGNERLKRLRQQ
jgi:hypothetical protein